MKNEATDKRWAELHGATLTVMRGRIAGRDEDGDDILTDVAAIDTIPLPDDEDETWIKALTGLGYRPLPDTVAFDGDTITFDLERT